MTVNLIHPTRPLIDEAGPCGCTGCEKWSDCDYCGTCTPDTRPHQEMQPMIDHMETRYDDSYNEYGRYELDYDDPRNMDLYDGD